LVSIIIACFNKLEYTSQCVESIEAFTPEEHEVIFIDNGSTDGTGEWIKEKMLSHPNYRLIENEENKGFPVACNQGIELSQGEYIVLLNNDVVVSKEWLKGLIECAESSKDIAIVGPRSNFVSGPQIVTDTSEGYDSLFKYQQFAEDFRKAYKGFYTPYWRIVFFCALIKREVFDKVGLLDERFTPGNFDDDDYCRRVCLAGYRNMICGDVFVHHHGSKSFAETKYAELLSGNEAKFIEKWADYPKTISACMIVRDEEDCIAKCLDSISPHVDEIVVVDTGSKDRTKEIVSAYPKVKLYDFEWVDDFSEARNFANSKATMAWILSVDADEVLTGLEKLDLKPFYAYRITTRNYTTNQKYANITWNKGEYAEEQGYGWFPSTKVRIWPRDERIVWEYPVHEVVENSVYYLGMGIIECKDVVVHHFSRVDDVEYMKERAEKYYDLLHKQFKSGKSDLRSLEQLAVQAQGLKRYDEAKDFWKQVIELDPTGGLAPLNMCHCIAEEGDWKGAREWATKAYVLSPDSKDAAQNLALCEFYAGDDNLSEKICRDLLNKDSRNPVAVSILNAIKEKRKQSVKEVA
jgi:GT2 family glycosyltransferase